MNKKRLQKLVNIFRYVPHVKVVAITGGPCAGKTTFLKMAIVLLQKTGHFVIVVPEIAREIIAAGILPNNPGWRTPTDFQEHIILHSLEK